MEPLIAVVGQPVPAGEVSSWKEDAVALPGTYLRALHRARGQEAILSPHPLTEAGADDLLSRFDGLLLVGGGDVDPSHYGEDPLPECYGIDSDADLFEMNLVRAAVRRELPVLAVCRGIQVLNVSLGGTLDQHITGRPGLLGHGTPGGEREMHPVRVEPGSWTAKAMGTESSVGWSSHHQALARIGEGLVPVGWTKDGVVEAVEHQDGGWVIGVQWHPERSAETDPGQQGLFDALVERSTSV
jgi:putative glutamine amidotransferase